MNRSKNKFLEMICMNSPNARKPNANEIFIFINKSQSGLCNFNFEDDHD